MLIVSTRLVFRDGNWVIRDLGSTNGTRVNGALSADPASNPAMRSCWGTPSGESTDEDGSAPRSIRPDECEYSLGQFVGRGVGVDSNAVRRRLVALLDSAYHTEPEPLALGAQTQPPMMLGAV